MFRLQSSFRHGSPSFGFQGDTSGKAAVVSPLPSLPFTSPHPQKRSIFSKIGSALKSVGNDIKGAAETAGNAIKNTAETVGNDVKNAAEDVANDVKGAVSAAEQALQGTSLPLLAQTTLTLSSTAITVNLDKSGSSSFSIAKTFDIVQKTAQCQIGDATLQATLDVSANAQVEGVVTYAIMVEGTLVPPKFTDFGLEGGLNAQMNHVINIQAQGDVGHIPNGVPIEYLC